MRHIHLLLHLPLLWRAMLSFCGLSLLTTPPALAQPFSILASQRPEGWACTVVPQRFWLPLSVLKGRLEDEGLTVLEAYETRDDCYTLRLVDRDKNERVVVYDPVSAKPLK